MAKLKKLKPVFDWAEVVADEKDWAASPPAALRNLLFQMYLVRRFERNLLELKKNNLIHGPVHTSIGQEAVAVGTMAALGRADGIGGTHRAHHQYLAKACSYHLAPAFDPVADEFPAVLKQAMATLLAEMTLPSDWMAAASSGSKAMSGTWADASANNTGTADFFRIWDSAGTTCHLQGTVTATGGGGDLTLDNTSIAAGQAVSITSFTLTDGNA